MVLMDAIMYSLHGSGSRILREERRYRRDRVCATEVIKTSKGSVCILEQSHSLTEWRGRRGGRESQN